MIYNHNEIARRARIASFTLMGVFVFLGGAFFKTQIIEHGAYALKSERNRIREIPIRAGRGTIYDRNGEIIAENVAGFEVSLSARTADSLQLALQTFSEFIPLDPALIAKLTSKKLFRADRPTVVLDNATFEQVALLEEHKITDLPGLLIEAAPKRHYPAGPAVAAFVGYVSQINETELQMERYAGYKQGQQIGHMGLEDTYESSLAGIEGKRFREVDADERTVRDEGVRPILPPTNGAHLYTNIEMKLQKFIADSILVGDVRGGALVMETESGAVLALHSNPSYDVNDFIGGISRDKWSALQTNPDRPMYNKVIKGKYPPASTFKLVTAIAALELGLVSLDERMGAPCTGKFQLGNRGFACWKTEGHGSLTLAEAIENSCNVYFYQLSQKIGLERLLAAGVRYRLGAASGIDLPGEIPSTYPENFDYYNREYPNGWSKPATELNLAIGQGEAWQTVANVARFYSALAMDGVAATPQIIKGIPPQRERIFQLSADKMQGVRDALAGVVSRGTAAGSRSTEFAMAGKTGTAQNGTGRDHAWFVGYAPADKPQLLVAIMIEYGEHGSTAARAAQKIFMHHFKQHVAVIRETGG